MALLDKVFKQRMVGALVLIALAVIFLPMLFSRQDEQRQVQVDAPTAPQAPVMPQVQVEPVPVPEPQVIEQEPELPVEQAVVAAPKPAPAPAPAPVAPVVSKPVAPAKPPAVTPAQKVAQPPAKLDTTQKRVDPNGLPISWSIQLVSLSNRASADNLQKTLRNQGYNAYVRSSGGMNRVFVGPLLERAEADRMRDILDKQQNLKGFVVRFQPERG
ncbi:SPOR domain-containing protein [Pseudomonas helleri]|jgi:DedD protein|uniref:SPOR domain-containing protein n=1 Tax=Pseudomonas helleri TaxID=1608996 RepID=A0A6A7YMC5_9PSED|nr:SPOR domain-containing protein [Pseudomonas helleri]MQT33778.1 SPOR domain-containing protein [Pseudomonas helleri]MQT46647.1 SPOR domain-containing protein [Pseudomonas helleri]MQT88804.1 SPOR domain-containing protein [Pseudomonas helleri]